MDNNQQLQKSYLSVYFWALLVVILLAGILGWVLYLNLYNEGPKGNVTISNTEETKFDRSSREFTIQELSAFDGKDSGLIFTAYKGVIYDVSDSPLFEEGKHYGHLAGLDLTEFMVDAPHADEVFIGFEVVGQLESI